MCTRCSGGQRYALDNEQQWQAAGCDDGQKARIAGQLIGGAIGGPFGYGLAQGLGVGPGGLSGFGDLTNSEVGQIQRLVNDAGRPLEVVGSSASGTRGPGSDIDYLVPPGSMNYYEGLGGRLPSIDPQSGIIPGTHNPFIGPGIKFVPNGKPFFCPPPR